MSIGIEDVGFVEQIRQRLGLEPNDTSKDAYICGLDPRRRVQLVIGWYMGDEAWYDEFEGYLNSQGLYITDKLPEDDL